MHDGTWTIFEEAWARDVFECLNPFADTQNWFTWDSFLAARGAPAPEGTASAREEFARLLKAAPSEGADWLKTIDQLREVPLQTSDDIDFSFSQLPASTKNTFLRQLLHLYLGSPLAQSDRTARTLSVMEQARDSAPLSSMRFIRSRTPSSLFADLARCFGAAALETWQWGLEQIERPVALFPIVPVQCTNIHAVDRLAEKAAQMADRLGAENVRVLFDGSDASHALFRCRLSQLGLDFCDLGPRKPTSMAWRSCVYEALRHAPIPLLDRLRLATLWGQTPTLTSPEDLNQWIEDQNVASSVKGFLLERTAAVFRPPLKPLAPGIRLLPFHPFPMEPGTATVAFLETLPEPSSALALDASERQRLRQHGFAIAEGQPNRESNGERLQALAAPRPAHRFLFLTGVQNGIPTCLSLRPLRVPRPKQAERLYPESFKHAQPISLTPGALSATALETYARCPAQYFYKQVLRLPVPQDPQHSFSLWFGELVHRTLERAFESHAWDTVDETLLLRLFDRSIEEKHVPLPPLAWVRPSLRRRFRPIAKQVPRIERSLRESFGALAPTRFEEDFETRLGEVSLKGRIDRIDQTPGGVSLLFYYKTGSVDFSPEHIRKATHFQASVYLAAAKSRFGQVGGVLFYDLKRTQIRRGLIREDLFPPAAKASLTRGHAVSESKWEEITAEGESHIQALALRIRQGVFDATPDAQTCGYCPFGTHCRTRMGWNGAVS